MTTYIGKNYKLRASNPMPTEHPGEFRLHTFMASLQESNIYTCTNDLPASSEFVGNGFNGNLTSASFSRLPLVNGTLFQGKESKKETFGDEDVWGFNN